MMQTGPRMLVKVQAPTRDDVFSRLEALKEEGYTLLGEVYFSGHSWKAVAGRERLRRGRRDG